MIEGTVSPVRVGSSQTYFDHAISTSASRCLPKAVESICYNKNLHTMFIAASFMMAKMWKQQRCLRQYQNYMKALQENYIGSNP